VSNFDWVVVVHQIAERRNIVDVLALHREVVDTMYAGESLR